jgi:hypothetical protein
MEGTLSTADYLALENRGYCYDHRRGHSGAATTGIGLAAGLGGGALLLAIAGLWGVNKASEARSQGNMALAAANAAALGQMNNSIAANRMAIETALANERASRESWQSANQPTIQSYIDVQATPSQSQTSTATAAAEAAAYAQLYNNSGLNSAIGTDSFLKVCRYSAPSPCGCDTCNG